MFAGLRAWAPIWILPLALSGCALNQLRVEEAASVAASGKVAVAVARDYLGKVATAREAANLEFVALDAECMPDRAFLRVVPQINPGNDVKQLPSGWLCSPSEIAGKSVGLSLAPPGRELLPTLRAIEGLATYFAAITDIVEEEGPTTSSDVNETIAMLASADKLFGALAKKDAALGLPSTDDGRVKAIVSFLKFLDQLQKERTQVAELRVLVANNDSAGTLMSDVRAMLEIWEGARAANADARTTNAQFLMITAMQANPKPNADARVQLVRNYYARAAAEIDDAKLFPALDATLKELIQADADMREALKENPNLNARQRARLAHLTRQRVTAAFNALTAIFTAFAKG